MGVGAPVVMAAVILVVVVVVVFVVLVVVVAVVVVPFVVVSRGAVLAHLGAYVGPFWKQKRPKERQSESALAKEHRLKTLSPAACGAPRAILAVFVVVSSLRL